MLISEPRPMVAGAVEPPFAQPRLRVLDLLRFCAAMAVVLFHFGETRAWGTPNAFPALSGVTMFGAYGVRLFFMISGFVILMSAWGRTPGEFVGSRIARLYPAYWASVVILGGLALMGFITDHRPTLSELLANLTMFQHGLRVRDLEIVYWTLWHELIFYVMIACFAVVGITYRRVLGFMGGWIVLLALAERLDISLLKVALAQFGAPYFIAGMALYLIYRFGSSLLPWLFVGVAYAFGMVQLLGEGPSAIKRFGEPLGTALVVGVISLMFLVMILVAVGRLDGADWRGLTLLGALTYPLYLFHHHVGFLLIQWLNPILGHRVTLPVVIGAVLLVAWAVYRFVEVPAQPRLKAALSRSLKIAD